MREPNSLQSLPDSGGPVFRRKARNARRWVVALCTVLATASFAQSSGAEPTAGEKETARQLFNEASDLRDKGNATEALAKFKLAHSLGQTPITGVELGKMHLLLGQLLEAREAFLSVARIERKPSESSASTEARSEAARLADEIKPRLPSISIKVVGLEATESPKVSIDDAPVRSAALAAPIMVNPGKHVVVVKVPGREDQRGEVVVKEGERRELSLAFRGEALVVPAKSSDASPALTSTQPRTPRPSRTLSYVGFGTGGAGLVFGAVTGVLALSKTSETRDACPGNVCPPSQHDNIDAAKSLAWMSTIGFAVAGAGAAAGVYGLLTGKTERPVQSNSTARVKPMIGPGYAGLYGRF